MTLVVVSEKNTHAIADPEEARSVREKTLADGKCIRQIINVRKNGERFPASLSASVLRDESGHFQGFVGTSRDITEQLNLEAQLRHSQKMDSIGQLAAGVAHDFNNVLTVIQGYASLLASRNNLAPDLAGPLNEISLASEHAASLTRQLLTFSRKQTIQPRSLDLNDVLRNITRMITRLLGAEIALKVQPAASLPSIHADAGMLEQVIINLAVNARDAMPKGGQICVQTVAVEIDSSYAQQRPEGRAGNFVCLSIADTGMGMDAATLTRIFEPFFTTKEPGKGTGLGLATVYGIVQSHRGWIEVNSAPGQGTIFKIFLPVAESSDAEQTKAARLEKECRGKETIFIVEDIAELRGMVRALLESYGYNVIEAANGVAALAVWEKHKNEINLLLTDVVMPEGMSGHDLAKKLLADKKSLEVIFTSGHSIDLIGRDIKLREGVNFLQKPYQALTLAQTIRNALDAAKSARR